MNSTETNLPSVAEKYGYGTIAIVIVSLLALIGIVLLPCFKRSVYKYILDGLNGLATGTLFCDALLHMIPEILNLHEDEEESNIHVPEYIIKICVAIACLYVFWLLEILARHAIGIKSNSLGGHGHSHDAYTDFTEENSNASSETQSSSSKKVTQLNEVVSNLSKSTKRTTCCCANLKKVNSLGWIIMIGDGLAVGASFSQSITLGVSTTIAVVCHEIPHELGNYAVLVKCGFTHCQALLFNLLSASTCFIGFYIGVSVPGNSSASEWILTITVGMFLYISLVELMPSLIRDDNWNWKMFLIINISLFIGFAIMFLLVLFEEHIRI